MEEGLRCEGAVEVALRPCVPQSDQRHGQRDQVRVIRGRQIVGLREDASKLVDARDGILKGFDFTPEEGNAIIMAARAHWFEGEEASPEAAPAEEAGEQPAASS